MKTFYQFLFALMVIGLFCVFSSFACGKYCDFAQPKHTKLIWKNHQAAELADAFGITPDSVGQPVTLWKRK